MSNFTKSVSLGAHNIAFSLLRKLVGTIPQVWEQSRPFLRWRVNLLWEQTQEGGNFLRACELADTTVPLYYDDDGTSTASTLRCLEPAFLLHTQLHTQIGSD